MTTYVKELPEVLNKQLGDARISGRKIKSIRHYPTNEDAFHAISKAKDHLKKEGYVVGSMCMDYPIAIAKNVEYIAKWWNIGPEDAHLIEGVIFSEDFREKDVYVVEFS